MNRIESGVIKYQIDLERYKNGKADEVVALLDAANKEISRFIRRTSSVSTKARYREIARKLREISRSLRESAGEGIDLDGLIDHELLRQGGLLRSMTGDGVSLILPSREQIKTAALFRPVTSSMTYDSYLDGIQSGLYGAWDSAVRTGYLTGQTTGEIVRGVMGAAGGSGRLASPGTMAAVRRSVWSNTRTVLQSFASETRRRVYEENEEHFGDGEWKYEYLASLDNRTCVVCGECGGRLYREMRDVPSVPQHRGCRCVILPYFRTEGQRQASKDGYVDSIGFEDWLREQDEGTQLDVLGRTRYEMFRRGERISQFVDNGRALTLDELRERL